MVEKLEKWNKADVNKALDLGKGIYFTLLPLLPYFFPLAQAHHLTPFLDMHRSRSDT